MKVLIVGCGSIGKRHLENLISLKAGDIGVFDVAVERSRALSQEKGVSFFPSMAAAIEWKPDAALITTPTAFHIPLAVELAQNGVHLFIEKPLSNSKVGVDRLAEITAKTRKIVLVGCNMRFYPSVRRVKDLLDAGAIGKVLSASFEFGQYLPDWHPWEDYRKGYSAKRALGGGIILDACHELDYALWYLGKPVDSFCAARRTGFLEIETEDVADLILKFESGVIASVHVDYLQRGYSRGCKLIGETGTLEWDFRWKGIRLYQAGGKEDFYPDPNNYQANTMYLEEMKHFLACVHGREKPLQDLESAAKVLDICLNALSSSGLQSSKEPQLI